MWYLHIIEHIISAQFNSHFIISVSLTVSENPMLDLLEFE